MRGVALLSLCLSIHVQCWSVIKEINVKGLCVALLL